MSSPLEELSNWTDKDFSLLKAACEDDHLAFTSCFFKVRDGSPFIVNAHHPIMCNAFDRVFSGEIKRLIITVPPGYTKTEIAVINLVARGLAINRRAKFIHASYSGDLAMENSAMAKEVIESELYQRLWPMELKKDSKSKKKWYNQYGGGLYAVAAGGQITGFRAGRSYGTDKSLFSGAFLIDDPIKPDDAFSSAEREKINRRFTNVFQSRLLHSDIPIVVIMQRLHSSDPVGFLLRGGNGEYWHHLDLPVLIKKDRPYPKEYTHGIPIPYDLPEGPLWEYKHSMQQIETLKTDEYTYSSQYDQRPSPAGGSIFKADWWGYYVKVPKLKLVVGYVDTATKKGKHNDYTAFGLFGLTYGNQLCVLDIHREKMTTPEVVEFGRKFWNKHKRKYGVPRVGMVMLKVEDKNAGTSLIQFLKLERIPIKDIQREKDKIQRAVGAAPEFKRQNILLPLEPTEYSRDISWVYDYKKEFKDFTPTDTHDHDDQVDVTLDAVEDLLISKAHNIYDNL